MSRKRKKRARQSRSPLSPVTYAVGTQVRVRCGTRDPDFSDLPLGGWSGTIREVDQTSTPPRYRIEWDGRTRNGIHPVYRQRCQRDGLDHKSMWLPEGDLEPDTGQLVAVEQPTNLLRRPLPNNAQDERIRAIFGLTADDPLPLANKENLGRYHRHLESHLAFPFQALYRVTIGPLEDRKYSVQVNGLLDPDESDEAEGLLCVAVGRGALVALAVVEIEVTGHRLNGQLLDDYSYWFRNGPAEGCHAITEESVSAGEPSMTPMTLLGSVMTIGAAGGFYGAVLGAALASLDGVFIAVKTGGILLGLVGCFLSAQIGVLLEAAPRRVRSRWSSGFIGLVLGAGVGAMLGALLMAFVGAILGGLVGGIAIGMVRRTRDMPMARVGGVWVGAMLGVAVQSWRQGAEQAWSGCCQGGITGVVAGPILMFALGTAVANLESEGDESSNPF